MDFGSSLRKHRKERKLTLAALGKLTGLSISYLSKLENGVSTPSLANMQKLCEALQISMIDLLDERFPCGEKILARYNEQPNIFSTESGVLYNTLFDKSPKAKIVSMIIDEDNFQEEMSWGHHYDEFGIVVEGAMNLVIGEDSYAMTPGDVIFIKAHTIHKYRKTAPGRCVSFWIYV